MPGLLLASLDSGKLVPQDFLEFEEALSTPPLTPSSESELEYLLDSSPAATRDLSTLSEQDLIQLIKEANTLEEYQACAERLDNLQGHNEWKQQYNSCEPEYDPNTIQEHMRMLKNARDTSDVSAMQHLLRTTLSRDLGGMNMMRLYKHSWSGTKVLIEDYISCVLSTIEKFAESAIAFNLANSEVQFYKQSLEEALKYFGRSALNLSGGGTLGMKHSGVVKALWDADVLPEIISGSSAGSIIASIVGVCSDDELSPTLQTFSYSDLACFDPHGTGPVGWFKERFMNYRQDGTLFQMKNLERVMKGWLGDMTFREGYNKSQRVLNICVSSADSEEPRLLNYITAPNVLIWSAVCASCSVPTVFPLANIYEKDPETKEQRIWMEHAKQLFVDGSLDQDIPMRKLSEMFNVNFFIVSQVNPHVRLFLPREEEFTGTQSVQAKRSWLSLPRLSHMVLNTASNELLNVAQQLRNCGATYPQVRWASVLSQKYTGDINILPSVTVRETITFLTNPTPDFMQAAERDGERATWPRIYQIKNSVAIELGLIRAIHTLKERLNFGPEAQAARSATHRTGKGRSYSITGQRPGFLAGRSVSSHHVQTIKSSFTKADISAIITAPSFLNLRRNQSLGALDDRASTVGFMSEIPTPVTTPGLSPGVMLKGSLAMTTVISHDDNPYFRTQIMDGYMN